MVAVLGTFGSALGLEEVSHEGVSLVILSVVLALSLSRLAPTTATTATTRGLTDVYVVPLVALSAGALGQLMAHHFDLGGAVFTLALAGALFIRQFGPWAARVGRLSLLPLMSLLVVPAAGLGTGPRSLLWEMAAALLALAWVTFAQTAAARLHLLPPPHPPVLTIPSPGPAAVRSVRRLSTHTRMALQLAVAVGAAFVIGRTFFPLHWNWTVLTATIVCGGGPGRGDVVSKGAARLAGATVGTVLASLLAVHLPGHDDVTIVLIFVLLFVGSWWRELHYAVWAACATCVMALLNGYEGVPAGSLLTTRLLAIVLGAATATAACCLVFPTPTSTMVRLRRAQTLQALSQVLASMTLPGEESRQALVHFEARLHDLRRTARPLHLQQRLLRGVLPPDAHLIATVKGVMACAAPVRATVDQLGGNVVDDDTLRRSVGHVAHNLGLVRRIVAGRASDGVTTAHATPATSIDARFHHLNEAVLAIPGALGAPIRPRR